ncbi:hypothetical protein MUK42_15865 [Musa troglodytarum]|uniref:Uncharacterized protein n=1 Tax=Musa troglodytarum TaxID=320322 RepID=A0A9E7GBR8_9LILI|nr:hypothetical protein MUK42_15865 [Musa troglodytarum]
MDSPEATIYSIYASASEFSPPIKGIALTTTLLGSYDSPSLGAASSSSTCSSASCCDEFSYPCLASSMGTTTGYPDLSFFLFLRSFAAVLTVIVPSTLQLFAPSFANRVRPNT